MRAIRTKSAAETKKVTATLAKKIVPQKKSAMIFALKGNLGAGKTTFAQGFAKALGVKEKIQSPTFVLLKIYPLKKKKFKHLTHVDCYRIASPKELLHLGFKNFLKDNDAIILIEWADRVRRLIPKNATWISFKHLISHQREITIKLDKMARRQPD